MELKLSFITFSILITNDSRIELREETFTLSFNDFPLSELLNTQVIVLHNSTSNNINENDIYKN